MTQKKQIKNLKLHSKFNTFYHKNAYGIFIEKVLSKIYFLEKSIIKNF